MQSVGAALVIFHPLTEMWHPINLRYVSNVSLQAAWGNLQLPNFILVKLFSFFFWVKQLLITTHQHTRTHSLFSRHAQTSGKTEVSRNVCLIVAFRQINFDKCKPISLSLSRSICLSTHLSLSEAVWPRFSSYITLSVRNCWLFKQVAITED